MRTTSPAFARWLDEALTDARTDDEAEPLYSVIVGEGAAGRRAMHSLYLGCGILARSQELEHIQRALLADMETMHFATRTDAVTVEAGLVSVDGVAALVPSAVVMRLASYGSAMPRRGVTLPDAVRTAIDPETGMALPLSPGHERSNARPVAIDAVVAFSLFHERPVHPVSRATALHQLAASALNLEIMGSKAIDTLARVVVGSRCLGIHRTGSRRNHEMLIAELRGAGG